MAFSDITQKIYMVTGKGGVGKSAIAAALALKLSRRGLKVLLVELGEQSYFTHIFKVDIKGHPVSVEENLDIALWSGETCLREYVEHLLKIKKIVDLFFNNKIMRTFIKAAPALKELAILGKLTSGIRRWGPELSYDVIVLDSYSTGHHLALLKAPMGMVELIDAGPMGEQSRNIIKVLKDSDHVENIIVSLPEEMPVAESIELRGSLKDLLGKEVKIICNKVYREPIPIEELKNLENKAPVGGEKDFIRFLSDLLERQKNSLKSLSSEVNDYKTCPLILKPSSREIIEELSHEELVP